jgi:hypothetical protein
VKTPLGSKTWKTGETEQTRKTGKTEETEETEETGIRGLLFLASLDVCRPRRYCVCAVFRVFSVSRVCSVYQV